MRETDVRMCFESRLSIQSWQAAGKPSEEDRWKAALSRLLRGAHHLFLRFSALCPYISFPSSICGGSTPFASPERKQGQTFFCRNTLDPWPREIRRIAKRTRLPCSGKKTQLPKWDFFFLPGKKSTLEYTVRDCFAAKKTELDLGGIKSFNLLKRLGQNLFDLSTFLELVCATHTACRA